MKNKNIKLVIVAFLIIFSDQFSKWLFKSYFHNYICNSGAAFGLKIPNGLLIILISFIVIILYWNKKNIIKSIRKHNLSLMSFLIIAVAALSNLIDRIHFGCVVDFIDIKIFNYPWFNIADSLIVIAGAYLIWQLIYVKNKS